MPSKLNLNEADFTIPFSVTKTTHGSTVITDSDDQLLAVLSSPTASQVGPLFAAAPDLFRALEALRNECSGTPRPHVLLHLIEHADDALARAINLPIKVEA